LINAEQMTLNVFAKGSVTFQTA